MQSAEGAEEGVVVVGGKTPLASPPLAAAVPVVRCIGAPSLHFANHTTTFCPAFTAFYSSVFHKFPLSIAILFHKICTYSVLNYSPYRFRSEYLKNHPNVPTPNARSDRFYLVFGLCTFGPTIRHSDRMHNNNSTPYKSANNRSANAAAAFQRSPNFAIVRLSEGTDVLRLYQLLLENGYPEVSFVNEMRENAFLPYGMQNQTQLQEQPQNDDQQQSNLVNSSGDKTNLGTVTMAVERKASFEAVRREQHQHYQSSSHAQLQQYSATSPRVRPASAVGKGPLLGRASSSSAPSSNPQSVSHRLIRTTNNRIAEDGALRPAISEASPSSSSSSTAAMNGGEMIGGSSASVPLVGPTATASTGKKSDEYAVCLLCNNRIMSSRLSNLTNHVRRHASLKQYRCCHCHYSHNEMAKVRLHMSHNHHDFSSQPMDMLSFEMQLQWGLLMEQCFPEHSKRFGPSAANSQFRNLEELQKYVDMEHPYTCIECGEVLTGYQLVTHLEDVHRQECVPFACGQCGYQSSSQWKVRLHISVKHPERAAETTVATLPAGSNFMLFLQKFFSEVHIPVEEDETKLVAELQEKNSNRLMAALNAISDEGDGMESANDEECNGDDERERVEDSKWEMGSTGAPSPDGEEDSEMTANDANGEGQERRSKKGADKERSPRRISAPLEDEGETVPSHIQQSDKSNSGKKVSSMRKREKSLAMENDETVEQPTEKRHTLRHSNRLLMVAEKRNISLVSTATPMAIATRKK